MTEHDHDKPKPTGDDEETFGHNLTDTLGADGRDDPGSALGERLEIVAERDLMAAIDSAVGGLGDDDLSSGEAQRVARLRALLGSPWSRRKRRLLGSRKIVGDLENVLVRCPNFAAVTEHVIRAARLSAMTQTPLALPPLLLLGDPGIGKSHYSRELAAALGSDVTMIAGTTLADSSSLVGLNPSWRGARPGKVASALLDGRTCSPVILIDEIDKITGFGPDRPLDALLGLLEPSDARCFSDDYLGVPMRADGIVWICTANDIAPLSAPLRDRLLTIRVPPLSSAQRDAIAMQIFADLNQAYDCRFTLAADALAPAQNLTTRRLKAVLTASLGYAAAAARLTVTNADIVAACALVMAETAPAIQIGFGLGRRQD